MSVEGAVLICLGVAVVVEAAHQVSRSRAWRLAFLEARCRLRATGHRWQFDVSSQRHTLCLDCGARHGDQDVEEEARR